MSNISRPKQKYVENAGYANQAGFASNASNAENLDNIDSTQFARRDTENTLTQKLKITNSLVHGSGNTNAIGNFSHGQGENSIASGYVSHAEGSNTSAEGAVAHSEGGYTLAKGQYSHAEGWMTKAVGTSSHVEGNLCEATGSYSHAEGNFTIAVADYQHTQGKFNQTSSTALALIGNGTSNTNRSNILEVYTGSVVVLGQLSASNGVTGSFKGDGSQLTNLPGIAATVVTSGSITGSGASGNPVALKNDINVATLTASAGINISGALNQGFNCQITGTFVHVQGFSTRVSGAYAHAEGYQTFAAAEAAHAEGYQTTASNRYSHTEGHKTYAGGYYSHAEGYGGYAGGQWSHTEGYNNTTWGFATHAEGVGCYAREHYSHAEGSGSITSGSNSHAEGTKTVTVGDSSHSEGFNTTTLGQFSHAEGYMTTSSAVASHSEGLESNASGAYSHAEGYDTTTIGTGSHAEGKYTLARGNASHAEGYYTTASGDYSHAEGEGSCAIGVSSKAGGYFSNSGGNNDVLKYDSLEGAQTYIAFKNKGSYPNNYNFHCIASGSGGVYAGIRGNYPYKHVMQYDSENGDYLTLNTDVLPDYSNDFAISKIISGSDGLYVSFIGSLGGIYRYNNISWTKIINASPDTFLSSSDGIYYWDSSTVKRFNGSTTDNLFGSPMQMTAVLSSSEGIYFGFGASNFYGGMTGIWNGSTFTQIPIQTTLEYSFLQVENFYSSSQGLFLLKNANNIYTKISKWNGISEEEIVQPDTGRKSFLLGTKNYLYFDISGSYARRYSYRFKNIQTVPIVHGGYVKDITNVFNNRAYFANSLGVSYFEFSPAGHQNSDGAYTHAIAAGSHTEGYMTTASADFQHVQGTFNQTSSAALHIIGNGTADNARSNIFEVHPTRVAVSGAAAVTTLSGTGTRVVYATSDGTLTHINNGYTYDTANILASYKIRLSGTVNTSGSIFTVPADKSMFVPMKAVLVVESGSFGTGLVSVGHAWASNEMFYESDVPSMTKGEFIEIPLRSPTNSLAPTSSQTVYCQFQGGPYSAYTASLNIIGYYI